MSKSKAERRQELEAMSASDLARILGKLNPFGGYSPKAIEKHRDSYVESILKWEKYV